MKCQLTAIVDLTKLSEIVKPGGFQGIQGTEEALRQFNQLLFTRPPPKLDEQQNNAKCELTHQRSDDSIESPCSAAPSGHGAVRTQTEHGPSQPQAPRVYCPKPVKASQKNLAMSVTGQMNNQLTFPRSHSGFSILPETIPATSVAPTRGVRKTVKPATSRVVKVVRDVPDTVVNDAITRHRQNVPWLKVFYKLLSDQYRSKLGKVMNDLDIDASHLPEMGMKELRNLWRITHRRWHSSRQCQERKERARQQAVQV